MEESTLKWEKLCKFAHILKVTIRGRDVTHFGYLVILSGVTSQNTSLERQSVSWLRDEGQVKEWAMSYLSKASEGCR